ncbi:hypothetical protein [Parabacteroides goldsteinii]|uniref:hypothetical protein n=1 Tax=Parabacteroides goldsteinii TaxID=328812 RepID=UPI002677464E|nr:hypothetical protein [Parabacteroides goldsteinii]
MKQKFILSLLGMMLSFMVSLPVLALTVPEAAVETTGDYDAVFLSLSAIVAVVPLIVEIVKGFFPGMEGIVTQIVSWVVGIGITMFGWWQHLGFLDGIEWYIALLYGLGSGLAANGIADTGLIEWVIGLFRRKSKAKV